MTSVCACGEPLQRLLDGEMADRCYRCMGGTRELRGELRGKIVAPEPGRPVSVDEPVELTDEHRSAGRAGIAKAREALRSRL